MPRNLCAALGLARTMRGLSYQIRAELAREQARRARSVAAGIACPTARDRLHDCADAWEFDARLFETVHALPARPTYLNDLQNDILKPLSRLDVTA